MYCVGVVSTVTLCRRVCVGWLALIAFQRRTANPLIIPKPNFCVVDIDGVGAVYECPKKV